MSSDKPVKKFELPEDRTTKLFVLSMASNFVLQNMFTSTVYQNEIKDQQITSLSRMSRDIHKSFNDRLAAEKRERGLIDDVNNESVIKRPPNWLVLMALLVFGVGIIAYGQYNPQFSEGFTAFWNANAGYIIVAFILFLAVFLLVLYRRRRSA